MTYLSYKQVCNDECISTISLIACAQFLSCHGNTGWWETCTTTRAKRSWLCYKHYFCVLQNYVQCSENGMHFVFPLPWQDILVRNLYNYQCWQNWLILKNRIICVDKCLSTSQIREATHILSLPWEHIQVRLQHKYWYCLDLPIPEEEYLLWQTHFTCCNSDIHPVNSVPLENILVRNL